MTTSILPYKAVLERRGFRPKFLMTCIEEDPRPYSSKQLAKKLKQERLVDLSSDRLGKLLRKKGYRWKRTRVSHKKKRRCQI